MHELLYTVDINGCIDIDTVSVEVHSLPAAGFTTAPDSLCINSGMATLQAYPAGASVTGTGVVPGGYDPSVDGPGNHSITYTFTNAAGCSDSASVVWTVNPAQSFTINDYSENHCESDPPVPLLIVQPTGGYFSGPGVVGSDFDPALAGPGLHTVTYTYTNSFGCISDTTLNFDVVASPTVGLSGLPDACAGDPAWTLTGGTPSGGIYSGSMVINDSFDPHSFGSFTVTYTFFDPTSGCMGTATDIVEVHDLPPTPTIQQNGHDLMAQPTGYVYQWQLNGSPMAGYTSQTITAPQDGEYTVTITSPFSCSAISAPYQFTTVGMSESFSQTWSLYPNPTAHTLRVDGQLDVRSWAVLDISGRTVISGEDYLPEVIDVARRSNGKYFLRITTDQNTEVLPFVVQH